MCFSACFKLQNESDAFARVSPHENHAGESTVHLTDFSQIWHTCVTSLVHRPGATEMSIKLSDSGKSSNLRLKYTACLITCYKFKMKRNEVKFQISIYDGGGG